MPLDQAMLDALKSCCKDDDAFEHARALFESHAAKSDEIEAVLQHTIDVLQGEARERLKLEENLAAQEHFYRTMFEHANIGLGFKKNDKVVRANRVYLNMLGYTADELAQLTLADLIHPDDLVRQQALNTQLERGEISQYTLTTQYIRKDGSIFWAEVSVSSVQDKRGEPLKILAMRDLSQEILAQEKIRQSEAQLAWLLNALPFAVAIYKNKVPIFGNRAFYESRGLRDMAHWLEAKQQEPISHEYALIHPEDYTSFVTNLDDYRRRVDSGELLKTERRIRRYGEAEYLWYECSIFKGNYIDGEKVVVEADVPIEARKQAELAVQETKLRVQNIIAQSAEFLIAIDANYRLTLFNQKAEASLRQVKPDLQLGDNFLDLVYKQKPLWKECIERAFRGEAASIASSSYSDMHPNATAYYETTLSPIRNSKGDIQEVAILTVDVTERKLRELELLKVQNLLSETEQLAHIGSWTVNFETNILSWSDEVFRIYEIEKSLGAPSYEEMFQSSPDAPTIMPIIKDATENGIGFSVVLRLAFAENRTKWVEAIGKAIHDEQGVLCGYSGYVRDITSHKKKEAEKELLYAQLLQSQKMESIGVLASGIAHEFNNILMGILGATTLLKKEVAGNPKGEKRVAQIETASQRAATIVKQMLGFARQGKMNVQTIDLRQCIKNVLNMIETTIDKSIVVKTDFQVNDATAFMEGDAGQLEQVILNLAVNARDALLEAIRPIDNPEISFTLTCETLTKNLASESSLPSDMKMLHLAVRDNGIGMSKEVQAKIFEPFFTTKEVGKGTGLGLSMVYGIVKNHQGFISVESTVGEGTTFHLYFPLSEKRRIQIHSKENPDVIGAIKGTILVVDDEPLIREFLTEILEENGYLVYTESSGKSGLAFFEVHQEEIDLVVTDRNMPELDGERLLMQLKSIRPSLPVILITGNIENDISDRMEQSGAHKVLRKPFDPEELLSAIASALQSR